MRLNINVFAEKTCELFAIDRTVYHEIEVSDVVKHVFVEFVCYFSYNGDEEKLLALDASKKITYFTNPEDKLDRQYTYKIKQDGRYRYYKYGLYTIDHPSIYDGVTYRIQNKVFFHEGKIYYGLQDTSTPVFNSANSKIITNWYTLREYTPQSIDFWYDTEIFSICNLNKCLVALQKKAIFDGLKNCNFGECDKDRDLKAQRDFLFISVFVLDYLMDIGNYEEAQRILESLSTCASLCDDNLLHGNTKCCG